MSQFDESKHNRATDGKFANKPHAEADGISLTTQTPTLTQAMVDALNRGENNEAATNALVASIETELNNQKAPLKLLQADYGESLERPEDISAYLKGDTDGIYERVMFDYEGVSEYNRSLDYTTAELIQDRGLEYNDLHPDVQDAIQDTITDADQSDIVQDLAANTPTQLLRRDYISEDMWKDYPDQDLADQAQGSIYTDPEAVDARVKIIEDTLVKEGVLEGPLSEKDRDAVTRMVEDGPEFLTEAVSLGVIWGGRVQEAGVPNPDKGASRTVRTTEGTRLVLLDSWQGGGWDCQIDAPATMKFTPEHPARLDSEGGVYGWGDVAGVSGRDYATRLETLDRTFG